MSREIEREVASASARAAMNAIEPFLKEYEQKIVSEIKNTLRTENFTDKSLLIAASKLICLEDLENNIKSKIRLGENIVRENKNATGKYR